MNTNFEPTDEYYRRILEAPNAATRQQMYLDLLVKPWQPMMAMMSRFGGESNDPLSGARAWAWLLTDQTEAMAAILQQLKAADAWRVG